MSELDLHLISPWQLDPLLRTRIGVAGHDTMLTARGPRGIALVAGAGIERGLGTADKAGDAVAAPV